VPVEGVNYDGLEYGLDHDGLSREGVVVAVYGGTERALCCGADLPDVGDLAVVGASGFRGLPAAGSGRAGVRRTRWFGDLEMVLGDVPPGAGGRAGRSR
jgi:hypothetical protein